jgi:hypothetical protein
MMPREYITDILMAREDLTQWLDPQIPAHQKRMQGAAAVTIRDMEPTDKAQLGDEVDSIDKALAESIRNKMFVPKIRD